MAAQDIKAQVELWVIGEIKKQGLGEDFGFAVTWGPAPVQTPQGVVMVPAWQLLLTCANPLVGEGELYHMAPQGIGAPRPKEADVRREVASGISQLRDLAKSKISGSNGHSKLAVPG
jgi:hypothetical protein